MNDNENTPFPNLWVALFGGNYTSLFDYIEKRVKVNSYCFHLKNLGKDVQAPNQQKEENNNVRGDINEIEKQMNHSKKCEKKFSSLKTLTKLFTP